MTVIVSKGELNEILLVIVPIWLKLQTYIVTVPQRDNIVLLVNGL